MQTSRRSWRRYRDGIAFLVLLALTAAYSTYRIAEVEARMAQAETMRVGMVQVNMGIFEKMRRPQESLRRHIAQSLELEKAVAPDLIVWPESSYMWTLPESVDNVKRYVLGQLETPLVFGGMAAKQRLGQGRAELYNTAYVTDEDGKILGSYDKQFLLAFGEYLPLGEIFPALYDYSPNSGRFLRGTSLKAIPFKGWKLGVHICYEDILPDFLRLMVRFSNPDVLVNITNDAWFGDTHEPWIHLALAKLRAVEHHRAMVRATNSGVSAFIDPLGRVRKHTGTFQSANLHDEVPKMSENTLYAQLGDWPAYGGVVYFLVLFASARRRRKRGKSGMSKPTQSTPTQSIPTQGNQA